MARVDEEKVRSSDPGKRDEILTSIAPKPTLAEERSGIPDALQREGLASKELSSATDDAAREDDSSSLPKVADHLSVPVILAILVGGAERFCFFAVTTPWQNYIQNPPDSDALSGAFGLGQSKATLINNAYMTFAFLTPMPIALVSDLYLGRFKTLLGSLVVYFLGCVILFATSLPASLDSGAGLGGLAAAMVLIGIGVGGVKATFSPFLGDQCLSEETSVQRRRGRRVVVDRGLTLQLIYNVFYWATNIASLSMVPATFMERLLGFWAAYLLALAASGFAIVLLVASYPKLTIVEPQGNIIPAAVKVLACAARHGFQLEHTKSRYQTQHHERPGPWSDDFVDEIGMTLRTSRVLLSFILFYLCINQMYNNLISQAGQMRLDGVPNDMIQALAGVACVVLGPLIQWAYGVLARRRIVPGQMFLITVAFLLCAGAMAYSAGVQRWIYAAPPCFRHPSACPGANGQPNNVSVWVQTPVYFILAAAEICGFVEASRYAYTHSPKQAKSIVQALTQWAACVASGIGLALSPVAKDPDLIVFYSSLAGAMAVAAALFWLSFGGIDRK